MLNTVMVAITLYLSSYQDDIKEKVLFWSKEILNYQLFQPYYEQDMIGDGNSVYVHSSYQGVSSFVNMLLRAANCVYLGIQS